MSKKLKIHSYKQLENYLKESTDKEFFITNTSSNKVSIVVCRDGKLDVLTDNVGYWQWMDQVTVDTYLEFIKTGQRVEDEI